MAFKSHFIRNQWIEGKGNDFVSTDPATGETVWQGRMATEDEVHQAVMAARSAYEHWASGDLSARIRVLEAFRDRLVEHRQTLAETISMETGKPLWESLLEVAAMAAKVDISRDAYEERRSPIVQERGGVQTAVRFKPHGAFGVVGPFNMPGHLPNGHIVPALLAGNTVVFKPSRKTPGTAQKTLELWEASGIPAGVINLVQGDHSSVHAIVRHPDIHGLAFTGSYAAGKALHQASAEHPERILALEMGGNNPLVVHEVSNPMAAAYMTVQSAFITSGQRCSCARRLIVTSGSRGDEFVDTLRGMIQRIRVGPWTDLPEPFMGPVISAAAAKELLKAQDDLAERGGRPLETMGLKSDTSAMLTPGLMDVTSVKDRADTETFGPFLQLIRVPDFDAALVEANRTAYGLSAGILTDEPALYRRFFNEVRAGVINWNRPITGASSYLPFGGVGISGNHRPSGYYAADYCAYPVASLESSSLALPEQPTPGITL
ncbi:MAG: succinylglutamate-semialdehyde dehydrogenase [Deltaproteobacteria bacterium]|nr:succinylglutamate-semialdehyde dehydrogenase [Deltaproteobacteria bacterium]